MPHDENDKLRAGTLPADPFADTEPVNTPPLRGEPPAPTPEEEATAFAKAAPTLGALLPKAFDLMERRADGRAKPIATRWPSLNEKIAGGLWPGLHVLTGSTGTGKSQWILDVSLHAARAGTPVLYVGLELGQEDSVARLLGLRLALDGSAPRWSEMYTGQSPEGVNRAKAYTAELSALPFHLELAPPFGWSADNLRKSGRQMRKLYPEINGPGSRPILVVLDYLQVISPPEGDQRQELRERIGRAAYAGREMGRDMGMAVLLASSISRENALKLSLPKERAELGTGSAERMVGLGKESGEIEYGANTVIALVKGAYLEDDKKTDVHLAIAKLREGPAGWARLAFDGGKFWEPNGAEIGAFDAERKAEAEAVDGEEQKNKRAEASRKRGESNEAAAELKFAETALNKAETAWTSADKKATRLRAAAEKARGKATKSGNADDKAEAERLASEARTAEEMATQERKHLEEQRTAHRALADDRHTTGNGAGHSSAKASTGARPSSFV